MGERKARGGIEARRASDGTTHYYAGYVDVDGLRKKRYVGTSIKEARALREDIMSRVRQGKVGIIEATAEDRKRAALTVLQLCERFCEEYQGENLADVDYYRRQARSVLTNHVLPHIGAMRIMQVKRRSIFALRDQLIATTHPRTAQKAMRQLQRVFAWAIEREIIDRDNPVQGVRKPTPNSVTNLYNDDEVARLLSWTAERDPALYPVVAFAFYTGCRKGEIAAVRWGDVDFNGRRIIVQRSWKRAARKSGKPVVVAMHAQLEALLLAHRGDVEHDPESLIFPTVRGCMRSKFKNWGLDEAIVGAKVRCFRMPWHSFRHSHATTLAATGASSSNIRDALGQATTHMAEKYIHLAAEHVRAHVDKMPSLGPNVVRLDAARRGVHEQSTERNAQISEARKAL